MRYEHSILDFSAIHEAAQTGGILLLPSLPGYGLPDRVWDVEVVFSCTMDIRYKTSLRIVILLKRAVFFICEACIATQDGVGRRLVYIDT